jgi:dGTPase
MPTRRKGGVDAAAQRLERRREEAPDYRAPAQRDRDRVLYCGAFRRLGGVTQVVATSETLLVHNRLTHTLKVAQVARRLAEKIVHTTSPDHLAAAGGIDPDVVETAALAHDLGHPPFGHIAEEELQHILGGDQGLADGFEGNAQSFRIVTKLAIRTVAPRSPALNLTRASLGAILKYPWMRSNPPVSAPANKWAAYDTEAADYAFAMQGSKQIASPEARIMDWADDIAYAVHDVQDFYRAGLIPLDRLRRRSLEAEQFITAAASFLMTKGFDTEKCHNAFAGLQSLLPQEAYAATIADRAAMHAFASGLITRFADGISITATGTVREVEANRYELEVLKQLTWYYVINRPALATLQRGERLVVRGLFDALIQWAAQAAADSREDRRLPGQFRQLLTLIRNDAEALDVKADNDDQLRMRATVDYISSLTETQAVKLYHRIHGGQPEGSALDVWLRI